MCTVIMHMYCTTKVDTSEYFRAELSQLISVMRKTISQDIHNRGDKFDMGGYPCTSPSTAECARLCTHCPILSMFLSGHYLPWNGP